MKLRDYKLPDWKEGKIKRQKKIEDKRVLLLSIDRTVPPPREGRKNLLAIDNEENVLWIADLPTEVYDSYYEMRYENGIIRAESSNGSIVEIDPETGRILKEYMGY